MKRAAMSLVAVMALAGGASAQVVPVSIALSGANEVPPNSSPATGLVTGTYDFSTRLFSFSWTIQNLVGNPSSPGAHIHRGVAGSNGPVVFGFANPDGTWPLSGSSSWTVPVADASNFLNGGFYFNFHTSAFPAGEVRGQIVPTPGAAGLALAGGLLALRRRRK